MSHSTLQMYYNKYDYDEDKGLRIMPNKCPKLGKFIKIVVNTLLDYLTDNCFEEWIIEICS